MRDMMGDVYHAVYQKEGCIRGLYFQTAKTLARTCGLLWTMYCKLIGQVLLSPLPL